MTNDDGADAADSAARRKRVIASVVVVAIVLVGGGGALAATMLGQSPAAGPAASTTTPGAAATPQPTITDDPTAAPTGEPTSAPTSAPTPKPTQTVDPAIGQKVLDRARGTRSASFGDSVTARVTASKATTAEASGIGEVSGPAVRVTIKITNRSAASIDLATVVVNAFYGKDSTPASPVESASGSEPFSGTLRAGKSATGSYVFSVPKGSSDDLVVALSKGTDASVVVLEP